MLRRKLGKCGKSGQWQKCSRQMSTFSLSLSSMSVSISFLHPHVHTFHLNELLNIYLLNNKCFQSIPSGFNYQNISEVTIQSKLEL